MTAARATVIKANAQAKGAFWRKNCTAAKSIAGAAGRYPVIARGNCIWSQGGRSA
jgi:hypothetical protein